MSFYLGKYIIRIRPRNDIPQFEASLFPNFAPGTIFDGFAELQVTTRKRPCASAVRSKSFANEYFARSNNDNANANDRIIGLHHS